MNRYVLATLLVLCSAPAAAADSGTSPASVPGLEGGTRTPAEQKPAAAASKKGKNTESAKSPRAGKAPGARQEQKEATPPDVNPDGESEAAKAWRDADI